MKSWKDRAITKFPGKRIATTRLIEYLATLPDEFSIGTKTIRKHSRTSRLVIIDRLEDLESFGLLEIIRGKNGATNRYVKK